MRATGRAVRSGSRALALIFGVVAVQFTWDLLFSPWLRLGASLLGVAAAAAVVYLDSSESRQISAPLADEPQVVVLSA